jgi:hypothetical protein
MTWRSPQRDQVRPGEAQPVEAGTDPPQLAAQTPGIQTGHLDARRDHAGGHRIVVQDRADPYSVAIIEEPRTGDT